MSDSSSGSALDSPKCPLDERRSASELYVTLFVIHFTVIVAYCHLMSIRNEAILSSKPIFFVVTPLLIVLQHALALILIAANYLYESVFCKDEDAASKAYSSLIWLFGRIPADEDHYSPLPTTSGRKPSASKEKTSYSERRAKVIGRTVVVLALVAQCIGTIFLYTRRLQHDAVGAVDLRAFEFACGGLLVALLNLCVLWRIPVFTKPVLRTSAALSPMDGVVAALRDVRPIAGSEYRKALLGDDSHFVLTGGLALVTLIIVGRFDLLIGIRNFLDPGFWNKPISEPSAEFVTVVCVSWLAGFLYLAFYIVMPLSNHFTGTSRFRRRDALGIICAPVFLVLMFLLCMFAMGVLITFIAVPLQYLFMLIEISGVNDWPPERDCGMLWQDPVAANIWWLA